MIGKKQAQMQAWLMEMQRKQEAEIATLPTENATDQGEQSAQHSVSLIPTPSKNGDHGGAPSVEGQGISAMGLVSSHANPDGREGRAVNSIAA